MSRFGSAKERRLVLLARSMWIGGGLLASIAFSATADAQLVRVGPFGGVRVRVPFVGVDVAPWGATSVRAPFFSFRSPGYVPPYPYGGHTSPYRAYRPYASPYGSYGPYGYGAHLPRRIPGYDAPHYDAYDYDGYPGPGGLRYGYEAEPFTPDYNRLHVPPHQPSLYGRTDPYDGALASPYPPVAPDDPSIISGRRRIEPLDERVSDDGVERPRDVESLAGELREAAIQLRGRLAQRSDDGEIWIGYLGLDRILDALDRDTDHRDVGVSRFSDILVNFNALVRGATTPSVSELPEFVRTRQLLRQLVQRDEPREDAPPPAAAAPTENILPPPGLREIEPGLREIGIDANVDQEPAAEEIQGDEPGSEAPVLERI